jgi:hypothetical protein
MKQIVRGGKLKLFIDSIDVSDFTSVCVWITGGIFIYSMMNVLNIAEFTLFERLSIIVFMALILMCMVLVMYQSRIIHLIKEVQ